MRLTSAILYVFLLCRAGLCVEFPVPADPRLSVQLVAQEPDIVTPIGMSVSEDGRVWVIENNTHFRPRNYKGFASDRVQVFSDFDGDGHARKIGTFADGFINAMCLLILPHDGVILATRSEIFLLRDTKNSGTADERKTIVKLETPGNYPHNGLSGLALGPDGHLYFGLGENLGQPYKLSGSDGTVFSGGGEGGNIYRCRLDGSKLERIATGFWNPFGIGFDAFGRLFAVDNDSDGRPPCRLVQVVSGGDYGYRFRYGRSGLHPFDAWNGELPGTLPMIAPTGEAPCALIACESGGLPKEYRGDLLATSWGDHVILRFRLVPEGASFKSNAEPFVTGGLDFRPVALVPAPDGTLLATDWASTSYPVHGKGRIWRIRSKELADDGLRASKVKDWKNAELRASLAHANPEIRSAAALALAQKGDGADLLLDAAQNDAEPRARIAALRAGVGVPKIRGGVLKAGLSDKSPEIRAAAIRLLTEGAGAEEFAAGYEQKLLDLLQNDPSSEVKLEALIHLRLNSSESVLPMLRSADPFIYGACIDALARLHDGVLLQREAQNADARIRVAVLLAMRRNGEPAWRVNLPKFLLDPDLSVRRAAVQWVAEDRLADMAAQLAEVGRGPMSADLFEAYVAARALLSGGKQLDTPETLMAQVFSDAAQPAPLRALALRHLRTDHPALSVSRLAELLSSGNAELRVEAIRALAMHPHPGAQAELRKLALDGLLAEDLRADTIAGLARSSPTAPETRQVLLGLLADGIPWKLQREALRSLRGAATQPEVKEALQAFAGKLGNLQKDIRSEMAEQIVFALKSSGVALDDFKQTAGWIEARPHNDGEWFALADRAGASADAAAGARIFYHPRGAQCFICHRINGRGGDVGPELSNIGAAGTRLKIMTSILEPSQEIAPEFVPWTFKLKDGRVITGIIQDENINGIVTIADAQGKKIKIKPGEVEKRATQKNSLMPDGLAELLTQQEFRDLLEFLSICQRATKIERN